MYFNYLYFNYFTTLGICYGDVAGWVNGCLSQPVGLLCPIPKD